jgi:hypothetical protein
MIASGFFISISSNGFEEEKLVNLTLEKSGSDPSVSRAGKSMLKFYIKTVLHVLDEEMFFQNPEETS